MSSCNKCIVPAFGRRDFLSFSMLGMGALASGATPLPAQDSSLTAPLAKADCLVVREPHASAAAAGSSCVILKLGL